MFKDLLVNAYRVEIAPLDVAGAKTDGLARRSTLKPRYRPTVTLRAQFRWDQRQRRDGGSGRERTIAGSAGSALPGADLTSAAEMVITRRDAQRAGYTPRMGDRVLCVIYRNGDTDPVNLYVANSNLEAEHTGRPSDWLVRLTDRHPGRAATN